MSKINDFKAEVFKKLGTEYEKSIFIFEIGKLTRNKKPWFSTFITDSDQGSLIVFMISTLCYITEYREIVIEGIITSAQKYCGLAPSNKKSKKTNSELTERELPPTRKKRMKRLKIETKRLQRGRPKGSKNKKTTGRRGHPSIASRTPAKRAEMVRWLEDNGHKDILARLRAAGHIE